jgi:hypothetical protein
VPVPASARWKTIKTGIAEESGRMLNTSIAGRYIQPDCGSAAKGTPANWYGFQPGMSPARNCSPR